MIVQLLGGKGFVIWFLLSPIHYTWESEHRRPLPYGNIREWPTPVWSPQAQPLRRLASHSSYVNLKALVNFSASANCALSCRSISNYVCQVSQQVAAAHHWKIHFVSVRLNLRWNFHLNSEFQVPKSPLKQWNWPPRLPVPALPPDCHMTGHVSSSVWPVCSSVKRG